MGVFVFLMLPVLAQDEQVSVEETPKEVAATTKKEGKKTKSEVKAYVSPYYSYDDDGDSVPNGRDKCPNTPKGEKVTPFGCPIDTDFDGMYDYEDKCITVPGPKENFGCPWGDKDNDGVKDNIDKCPDTPGVLRFAGCPVPPKKDTDGDGVYDDEDICLTVPGIIANRGCPEIKAEEKAALKKAFDNLLFETGKDVIKTSSYSSLNDLAKVLVNNPQANLHLEGHTDNVGEDDANLTLSQNRSESVKRYLVSKGVTEERITTDGFGESKPVADNDSDKGRSLNRRVVMVIRYE
ncbi:OmpA family protein [Rhodocytophaga rosea]|uniref:OmpA family protein n=2 Tax=Rhodocytophaga rosea TaxID=2704465 RepID=A0A6C0GVI7_9BACT|nr:OmpA family protein [Rhodocytophaga rosea]